MQASTELIDKAKEIVLKEYPTAFCQVINIKNTVGTYAREEFVIEHITNKKDPEGDEREQLGAVAFNEGDAWIYAADRLTKYDNYKLFNQNAN